MSNGQIRYSRPYRRMVLFAKYLVEGRTIQQAVYLAGWSPGKNHGHTDPALATRKAGGCRRCFMRARERGQKIKRHPIFREAYEEILGKAERSPAEIYTRATDIAFAVPLRKAKMSDAVSALQLAARIKGMVKESDAGAKVGNIQIVIAPLPAEAPTRVVSHSGPALPAAVHALSGGIRGEAGVLGSASPGGQGPDGAARHLPPDV